MHIMSEQLLVLPNPYLKKLHSDENSQCDCVDFLIYVIESVAQTKELTECIRFRSIPVISVDLYYDNEKSF
jgi:hypothetical protein